MKIFDTTQSFCPICKNIIDAKILERDGAMFIKKTCPKHGDFEAKIAKHAWYYKGLNNFYNNLYGNSPIKKIRPLAYISDVISPLYNPYNSKLVCFIDCPKWGKDSIPLDCFRKKLERIKNRKVLIQLISGEPFLRDATSRDDLPEIVSLIFKSGNFSDLATDGIKISEDFGYLNRLKIAGLNSALLWMDALRSKEIQIKMRGKDSLAAKIKALENIKRLKISVRIVQPIARGINEEEIGNLLEFVRRDEFISSFWVRNNARYGYFSSQKDFVTDELVEIVANQSRGLFTLEDVYYFQKIFYIWSIIKGIPQCYLSQAMIVPRIKRKPLRDIFHFEKFSKILDEFEKIWPENHRRATTYFFLKCFTPLFKNLPLLYFLGNAKFSKLRFSPRLRYYCPVFVTGPNDLFQCDINKINRQCKIHSFNLGPENNVPYPYEILPYPYETCSDV